MSQPTVRRWIVGTLTLGAIRIGGLLPYNVVTRLGVWVGRLAYYVVPRIRKVGMANLDLAFGDTITPQEKRRILRKSAENIGKVGARFMQIPKLAAGQLDIAFNGAGAEYVPDVGAGGLLISAHLGNWEYIGLATRPFGMRGGGIVRPFDDPRVDAAIDEIRRAGGFDTISKDNAGMKILNMVKNGEYVFMLVDQSARESAVPTTFFGQPCWSTFAPAMVALRTKANIYPLFVVEEDDGSYTLMARARIEVTRTDDFRDDLVRITQQCQDAIEEVVREYPEQWLWFHRRWKPRPALEAEWNARRERNKAREPGAAS